MKPAFPGVFKWAPSDDGLGLQPLHGFKKNTCAHCTFSARCSHWERVKTKQMNKSRLLSPITHSLPAEVKMTGKVSRALSHPNPTTMAPTSVKLEDKKAALSSEGSNPLSTHSFYFPLLSNLP